MLLAAFCSDHLLEAEGHQGECMLMRAQDVKVACIARAISAMAGN